MTASDGPSGQEVACGHVGSPPAALACEHVIPDHDLAFARRFVGRGTESIWVCETCSLAVVGDVRTAAICEACVRDIAPMVGSGLRVMGEPQTLSRSTNLRFAEERVPIEGLDGRSVIGLAPVWNVSGRWMAVTNAGDLLDLDFSQRLFRPITSLGDPARGLFDEGSYPEHVQDKRDFYARYGQTSKSPNAGYRHWRLRSELAAELPILLKPEPEGRFVAVCNRWGRFGTVVETATGVAVQPLDRGDYHPEQTEFPVAWIQRPEGPLLVHGTSWNRLDVTDVPAGRLLTERQPTSYRDGEPRPEHYLDYFHGALVMSPDSRRIAEDGWVWHPVGVTRTWSVQDWIERNVWESEDGPSQRSLTQRDYFWGAPICWLGETELAVWGIGDDDDWMTPGIRVFDAETGQQLREFGGPIGHLVFDGYLFSFSTAFGTAVWDPPSGEQLLSAPELRPLAYHPADQRFLGRGDDGAFTFARLIGSE